MEYSQMGGSRTAIRVPTMKDEREGRIFREIGPREHPEPQRSKTTSIQKTTAIQMATTRGQGHAAIGVGRRTTLVAGGVLLALAPFFPWVHKSWLPGFWISISLNAYSEGAIWLTGAGALTLALVPSRSVRSVQQVLALVYAVLAVGWGLSLLRSTGVGAGSTSPSFGVVMAMAGWVLVLGRQPGRQASLQTVVALTGTQGV